MENYFKGIIDSWTNYYNLYPAWILMWASIFFIVLIILLINYFSARIDKDIEERNNNKKDGDNI